MIPCTWGLSLAAYRNAVLKVSARFEGLEFHHVARESNQAVDVLACMGAKRDPVPPNIFLERLFKPSVSWEGESGNNSPDTTTLPLTEHSDTVGGSANETTVSPRNNGSHCPLDRTIPSLPN